MRYDAIVLAYGKGQRSGLGYNKVLFPLSDKKTILEHALLPFIEDEECDKIIVTLEKESRSKIIAHPKIFFCDGGDERYKSVYEALRYVDSDHVMIHDGARPDITIQDLTNLKSCLKMEDACILASRAKDTIKVEVDGHIQKTLDRDHIYLAKTPQAFKSELIKDAYSKAMADGACFTDDAQVLELYTDSKIKLVECTTKNDKYTYQEDFI